MNIPHANTAEIKELEEQVAQDTIRLGKMNAEFLSMVAQKDKLEHDIKTNRHRAEGIMRDKFAKRRKIGRLVDEIAAELAGAPVA